MDDWLIDLTFKLPFEDEEKQAVEELRKRLNTYFCATNEVFDDDVLKKFLRPKNFNVSQTFSMLKSVHKARLADKEQYLPEGKGPLDYKHVYKLRSAEVLKHRNPKDGSAIVIIRVGDWTPSSGVDYYQALNAGVYLCEQVFNDERIQRDGATLILDCKGLHLSWIMKFFPPTCIPSAVRNLQETSPVRFVGVHILNQPIFYNVLYNIAWPFLSSENQNKINLHGKKITSLHEFVDPRVLPKDLQGDQESDFEWLLKPMYDDHEYYVKRSKLPRTRKEETQSL